jgi:hypothetical protein
MRVLMKKAIFIIFLGLIGFGIFVYFTEYYYKWSDYTLGVRNDTSDVLKKGEFHVLPTGQVPFGIMSPKGESTHEDPHWPLPEKFILSFDDPEGKHHELEVPSNLKKGFKGRITVVIKKNESGYYGEIQISKLDR